MFKWLSSIISSIISLLPFRRTRIFNCDKMIVGMDKVRCFLIKKLPIMVWFKTAINAVTRVYTNKSISRGK